MAGKRKLWIESSVKRVSAKLVVFIAVLHYAIREKLLTES